MVTRSPLRLSRHACVAHAHDSPRTEVLLTHERAFRRHEGDSPNRHLDKLEKYIEVCQAEGYRFELTQNY